MENKQVGYILLGISAIIIAIIFLFNKAMEEIVKQSCGIGHSLTCPMNQTVINQTLLSLAIVAILIIISIVLIVNKPKERLVVKKIKEKQKKKEYNLKGLRKEDKEIFNLVKEHRTIFQADLKERTGFGKAKVSRILDRLENKGYIERKRRGMTNVVVLKE